MKINEVDKVTTLAPAECITAIAADGSLIQIPVSEMAKVMAQVMPVATSEGNGLMSATGFINRHPLEDANKALLSGIYGSSGMTNTPIIDYSTMLVFANKMYIHQIYFPLNSFKIFYRFTLNSGKEWKAWKEIYFT